MKQKKNNKINELDFSNLYTISYSIITVLNNLSFVFFKCNNQIYSKK